jgi:septal ring factor EnvC (AmiA/AmiB activator)
VNEKTSAEIIPFPARAPATAAEPVVEDGAQERLRLALASLNAAIEEQRAAVAAWREALGSLRDATGSLDEGVRFYRDTLDRLGTQVADLNGQARRLESRLDSMSPR